MFLLLNLNLLLLTYFGHKISHQHLLFVRHVQVLQVVEFLWNILIMNQADLKSIYSHT